MYMNASLCRLLLMSYLHHWTCTLRMHIRTYMYMYLLDISRQLACMKLGRREKYQPIQYCWAGCLGYPVHTCHLPIDIQQIYCSAQTGQHERLRHSCCPVWALQHICTLPTYMYMYIHINTHVLVYLARYMYAST